LFVHERQAHNPDYEKSWVAFYFVDSFQPEKGARLENHLGKENDFEFCLIPDSDKLTELGDLSCALPEAFSKETKTIGAGKAGDFLFETPKQKGKFWVLVVYKDKDKTERKKSLSFNF